jgi:hypothetical protein
MQVRLLSDLHLEFEASDFDIAPLDTDKDTCLILAGDIHTGTQACNRIRTWAKRFKYIVYIAGNHEYYHQNVELTNRAIEDELCDLENTFFLSRQTGSYVELDDYIVWGDTLWTNLVDPNEPNLDYYIKHMMNDFRCISRINLESGKYVKFDPKCWRFYHDLAFKNLHRTLSKYHNKKVIVVSHHAPSEKSSLPCYIGQQTQAAYFTPLEGVICQNQNIVLWCHGHMHNNSDYMIGKTRVLCNPYGYAGYEVNPHFNNTLLLEV